MARPKINPDVRFADCKNILQYVLERGHGEIDCLNPNSCVNMLQRLNTYRKIVRENNDGIALLDAYVFLRRGNKIIITPRPTIDPSQLYDANGNSLAEDFRRWEAAEQERWLRNHGMPPTPQQPVVDDPNPFAPDKPLKLDDD